MLLRRSCCKAQYIGHQRWICQLVIELILGIKVPKVSVHVEHSILISSDFRSVRLDVYASDELKVGYDIEAQNEDAGNLVKM